MKGHERPPGGRKSPMTCRFVTTRGGLGPGPKITPRTRAGVRSGQNFEAYPAVATRYRKGNKSSGVLIALNTHKIPLSCLHSIVFPEKQKRLQGRVLACRVKAIHGDHLVLSMYVPPMFNAVDDNLSLWSYTISCLTYLRRARVVLLNCSVVMLTKGHLGSEFVATRISDRSVTPLLDALASNSWRTFI